MYEEESVERTGCEVIEIQKERKKSDIRRVTVLGIC